MKAISEARTCKDGCKYVRERLQVLVWRMQCTARTDAVHCRGGCSALRLFPANVCILCLKRLQPPLQSIATAIVNVCGEKTRLLWNPFPHVFLLSTRLGFSPNVGWPYHMVLSLRKGNASPEREELYSRLAMLWGTFPID